MAIQNFVSGGFYGKLGALVGQRWKNKRTIRTYVIPHDPKTKEQQANRGTFRQSVYYAQMGFQMNYACTAFDKPGVTKWQARVGAARDLEKTQTEPLNLIPVAPINFTAPFEVQEIAITEVVNATDFTIRIAGVLPENARKYSVMIQYKPLTARQEKLMLASGVSTDENPDIIKCTCEDTEGLELGGFALVVSADDKDSETDMVISQRLAIQNEIHVVKEFDVAPITVSRVGKTFTFTFAQDFSDGENKVTYFEAVGKSLGKTVSLVAENAELINNGGKFALQITDASATDVETIAFPSDSTVEIQNIYSLGDEIDYVQPEYSGTLVSDDLLRVGIPPYHIEGGNDFTVKIIVDVPVDDKAKVSAKCALTTNAFYKPTEVADANCAWLVSSGNPAFTCEPYAFPVIMRDECKISIPMGEFSDGEITYNFTFPSDMDFQNEVRVQPLMSAPSLAIDGSSSLKITTALKDWTAHPLASAQVVAKVQTVSASGAGIAENASFSVASLAFAADTQTISAELASGAGAFVKKSSYAVATRAPTNGSSSGLTVSELGIEYQLPVGTQNVVASWYSIDAFAVAPVSISRSGKNFTLAFAQDYRASGGTLKNLSLTGVSSGVSKTITITSANLVNSGGKFAVTFTDDAATDLAIIAFPAGSALAIGEISSIDGETDFKTQNYSGTVSSTDLTRSGTLTPKAVANGTYDFYFEVDFPATSVPSGTVAAQRTTNNAYAPGAKAAVSCVWAVSGSKIACRNASAAQASIAAFGCVADLPSGVFSAKGVTYNLSFTANAPYTNNVKSCTISAPSQTVYLSESSCEIQINLRGSSAYPLPEVMGLYTSGAILFSDAEGNETIPDTISMTSSTGELAVLEVYGDEMGYTFESGARINCTISSTQTISIPISSRGLTYNIARQTLPCEVDY